MDGVGEDSESDQREHEEHGIEEMERTSEIRQRNRSVVHLLLLKSGDGVDVSEWPQLNHFIFYHSYFKERQLKERNLLKSD